MCADRYCGRKIEPPDIPTINLLTANPCHGMSLSSPQRALGYLVRTETICRQLLQRDHQHGTVTSRLPLVHESLQMIAHLFIHLMKVPEPVDTKTPCIWRDCEMSAQVQLELLRRLWGVIHLYADLWHRWNGPSAPRIKRAQRAVVAMVGLAVFDAVLRRPQKEGETLGVTQLIQATQSSGGFSISSIVGASMQTLEMACEHFELGSDGLSEARNRSLAYLTSVKEACRHPETGEPQALFELGFNRQVELFQMDVDDINMKFLERLLQRMGTAIRPPGCQAKTDFEAKVAWLTACDQDPNDPRSAPWSSLGQKHEEFVLLRNFAMVSQSHGPCCICACPAVNFH